MYREIPSQIMKWFSRLTILGRVWDVPISTNQYPHYTLTGTLRSNDIIVKLKGKIPHLGDKSPTKGDSGVLFTICSYSTRDPYGIKRSIHFTETDPERMLISLLHSNQSEARGSCEPYNRTNWSNMQTREVRSTTDTVSKHWRTVVKGQMRLPNV